MTSMLRTMRALRSCIPWQENSVIHGYSSFSRVVEVSCDSPARPGSSRRISLLLRCALWTLKSYAMTPRRSSSVDLWLRQQSQILLLSESFVSAVVIHSPSNGSQGNGPTRDQPLCFEILKHSTRSRHQ